MSLDISLRHALPGFALDASFQAGRGVTAIFGRSGAGKTTVVNAVAGLVRPDAGRIVLDGEVLTDTATGQMLPPHRRRMGYVFQDARLFPHLNVRQNLTYGRWFAGNRPGPSLDEICDLLALAPLLGRRQHALSGGERQRVAIGRALLSGPRLLLMDEPLAALDAARKAEILPFLVRLRDALDLPILYVSHAMAEVSQLATTLVLLEAGRVVAAGPAAGIMADPVHAAVIGAREVGAVVTARVIALHGDGMVQLAAAGGEMWLPGPAAAPGSLLRLRIMAQDVMLALERPQAISALNVLAARITALQDEAGASVLVQLQAGPEVLLARVTRRSVTALNLTVGTAVHAVVKAVSVAQ